MSTSARATHVTPAAMITHSVALIRGQQHADISVYHARTSDARISLTFSGILLVIYTCHAAQGLLEAFAAARGHIARVPREIPAPRADLTEPSARVALSIEWTRRPEYAVAAQTSLNKLKTARIHWIDLYTGPITWQIRDQIGLLSTLELLTRVHRTATAVFPDGDLHSADPTSPDFHAA
ncbi:hypothetical protein [Mycobacterium branderi]|uniref:Uncharacterized protein n=1 Tax=Mycobacterium branderi TaxID=43348 RepID=A0A7I7WD26_9MYCO|nr:hypothetical protein [Mycobacterium branderi]MCV7234567.1 hypothetical protein [Mycobacterium branderi]ORA33192.1 hypothetical protein BST20_22920 [Mycobacterium branderi]BBZ15354.1 hypothetical protein MBRA_55490 [Mycobacterium branderi]